VSLKIVLADDSLTAQNMGKKILAEAGYEVIAVSNGAQAMKKIVSEKPDLVVLDVYMPGYSGLELCERMRNSRETARTPIVLTVGKMEAFRPEEANRVGADGLIIKPFEATELVAVVKKLAENLAPAPRPKRQPQPESVPQMAVEPTPAPVEAEFEIQHHAVEIPQEIASEPVSGMYYIPQEEKEPAEAHPPAVAHSSAPPIEFEVERDAPPAEIDPGPRMSSAAGLSGVFEMEPSAHPAVQPHAEPAPVQEFERFSTAVPAEPQPVNEAASDTGAMTIAHDFQLEEPLEFADELAVDHHTVPAAETWSAPPAATSQPSFAAEQFDQARPEPSAESVSPQPADVLPELASWDEPLPVTPSRNSWATEELSPELPAETPRLSADPVLDSSAAQFATTGTVWVAEETEIDPHESAISLHQQMQHGGLVDELLESEPATSPAMSAEASQSWEVPAPFASDPVQQETESSRLSEEEILPEFEPNPYAAPVQPAEMGSPDPYESPDFPADLTAATDEQPAAEPAPAPDLESYAAASDFVPRIAIPMVTEIPADPARIARIVEEALQRLKPELIAAVTRELQNKNQ